MEKLSLFLSRSHYSSLSSTLLSPTYSFFSHALTLFSHALTHRRSLTHGLTLPPLTLLSRSHSLCDLSPSHRFNFFFTVSKKIKLGENSQNLGLRKSKRSFHNKESVRIKVRALPQSF
ncbi:hypothetical protein QL285_006770 [Trifolium repens]|nr:hypothetical protein QL285_006770 [Trifolium repens]